MSYTIKYKKGLFWRTLKNVVQDGYIEGHGVRFFVFEDKTVLEIPVNNCIFKFDVERMDLVNSTKVEE